MTDVPGRCTPRFPQENISAVAGLVRSQLRAWGCGRDTLAVCGGAAGGDIIFAESACEIGAEVHLLLPFDVETFAEMSVAPSGGDWVSRFQMLRDGCTIFQQAGVPGSRPDDGRAFERNNLRILEHARAALSGGLIFALLLWDAESGDGDGGTADFARRCAEFSIETVIIHPTTLRVSTRRRDGGADERSRLPGG